MGFFSDLTFVEVRIVFLESGHFSVFNVPTYISDTVCRIPSVSGMGVEIQLEIVDRAAYSDGVGYIVGYALPSLPMTVEFVPISTPSIVKAISDSI